MRCLLSCTDFSGRDIVVGISLPGGPPKRPLEQGHGAVDPRMAGEVLGMHPLTYSRTSTACDKEAVRWAVTWIGLSQSLRILQQLHVRRKIKESVQDGDGRGWQSLRSSAAVCRLKPFCQCFHLFWVRLHLSAQ